MKKLIGLVIILVVLVLGSYYAFGLVTERTLKKSIHVLNQSNGVHVSISDYDRYWFSSHALVDVQVQVSERVTTDADGKSVVLPAQDYTFKVPIKICHGPLIFSKSGVFFGFGYAQTQINLPKEVVQKFGTYFTDQSIQPVLNFSVLVNYLNKSRFQFDIPSFKLITKEDNTEINWDGMQGHMNVSYDLSHLAGNFTLEGLRIIKDKVLGVLGPVTTDYDVSKTQDGLYLGDAGFSMPKFEATQDGNVLFNLVKLDAKSHSAIENGLFESDFKTSFEKIISKDKQYGPGVLEMSIKNLDGAVLAQLNTQAKQLQQISGTQRQQLMFGMLPQLPKLFAQGAIFEISTLKVALPEGQVDGNLVVSLPKSEEANPFQLMQHVEGHGKLQMPVVLLKKMMIESIRQKEIAQSSPQNIVGAPIIKNPPAPVESQPVKPGASGTMTPTDNVLTAPEEANKKLSSLVQANILVEEGQNYVIEFQLSQGKLTVNGSPFDPATFKL